MEVLGKRNQENGPKAEKDKTERAKGLDRRIRGVTEKWDQTDSPEIPDRGVTSEMLGLPSGGWKKRNIISYQIMSFVKYNNVPLKFYAMSFSCLKNRKYINLTKRQLITTFACTYSDIQLWQVNRL